MKPTVHLPRWLEGLDAVAIGHGVRARCGGLYVVTEAFDSVDLTVNRPCARCYNTKPKLASLRALLVEDVAARLDLTKPDDCELLSRLKEALAMPLVLMIVLLLSACGNAVGRDADLTEYDSIGLSCGSDAACAQGLRCSMDLGPERVEPRADGTAGGVLVTSPECGLPKPVNGCPPGFVVNKTARNMNGVKERWCVALCNTGADCPAAQCCYDATSDHPGSCAAPGFDTTHVTMQCH